MQIYAVKLNYFMRYGDNNNCVIFDLTDEQKLDISIGKITMSNLYEEIRKNPLEHINRVKEKGITKLIGILGKSNGSFDDSNGSGKSTLFEGITYVLYDKVVRKLVNSNKTEKAGLDIVTKFNKKYPKEMRESYVEAIFEEAGKIYRIKRGRIFTKTQKDSSPILEFQCYNEDFIDSQHGHRKDDTEINIEKVNMVDYDLFVSTQMFGQNDSGKFLIGTDKIKKEMIINLLKLDNIVDGCIGEVRSRKNIQDKKLQNIRSNVDLTEKNIYRLCLKWIDQQKYQSFSDDIVKLTCSIIEDNIKNKILDIEKFSIEIKKIETIIEELKKSDKILSMEKIKEEGLNLSKEQKEKEKQIEEQTKEWSLLIEENVKNCLAKKTQKNNVINKVETLKNNQIKNNQIIESPNVGKVQKYLQKLDLIKENKKNIEIEIEKVSKELEEIKINICSVDSKIFTKKEELEPLNTQISTVKEDKFICKHCKSQVSKEHILSEIENINKHIESFNIDRVSVKALEDKTSTILKDFKSKLEDYKEFLSKEVAANNVIHDYNEAKRKSKEIEMSISEYLSQVTNIDIEISNLENKNTEYKNKKEEIINKNKDSIIEIENKIKDLRIKYSKYQQEVKEIITKIEEHTKSKNILFESKSQIDKTIGSMNTEKYSILHYYEDLKTLKESIKSESKLFERLIRLEDIYGLDGIQTRIVQKYLPLLNVYVKEYMDLLTDGSKGIDIYINNKNEITLDITGNSAWSYEMSSGGEKMIIRLAVDIGLSLLSFSRLSKKPELICLDEIFGSLDNSHTQAVFKVLNRLGETFNRVIIIDHKSEIQKIIKDNIIIEKNDGSSSFSEIKCFGNKY